jgi:hypothetical protein
VWGGVGIEIREYGIFRDVQSTLGNVQSTLGNVQSAHLAPPPL